MQGFIWVRLMHLCRDMSVCRTKDLNSLATQFWNFVCIVTIVGLLLICAASGYSTHFRARPEIDAWGPDSAQGMCHFSNLPDVT